MKNSRTTIALSIAASLFAVTARAEEAWTPPAEIRNDFTGGAAQEIDVTAAGAVEAAKAAKAAPAATLSDAEKAKIIQEQEAPRLKALQAAAQYQAIDPNTPLPPLTAGDLKALMDAERLNALAAGANAAAAPIMRKIDAALNAKQSPSSK